MSTGGIAIETPTAGDVLKPEGEPAELIDAETEDVVFSIEATVVQVMSMRPERDDTELSPENGYFVVFEISAVVAASTDPSMSKSMDARTPILRNRFQNG